MDLDGTTIAALLGAGGFGTFAKPLFNYLRGRKADEQSDEQAGMKRIDTVTRSLIDRLEKQLNTAIEQSQDWLSQLNECNRKHAICEANNTVLFSAVNETRRKLGMKPVDVIDDAFLPGSTDGL